MYIIAFMQVTIVMFNKKLNNKKLKISRLELKICICFKPKLGSPKLNMRAPSSGLAVSWL